jgi:uncharacterized membrane protein
MGKKKVKKSFVRRLRNFFNTTVIGGMLVVLPITVFAFLINFLFQTLTNLLEPIRNLIQIPFIKAEWLINLIALASVIMTFFVIGLIVQTSFGQKFIRSLEERFLGPLPFYNIIRETIQQFFGKNKMPFSEVVSVDVFGNSTRMIGFVSDTLDDERFAIFVPTGPNPTNGFIFIVAADQIEYLNVRPEDAMRTIIGVGTGSSDLFNKVAQKEAIKSGDRSSPDY